MQKTDKNLTAFRYARSIKDLPLRITRHWDDTDWDNFLALSDTIEKNFQCYLDEREVELKQFEQITFENVEDIDDDTSADDIDSHSSADD